MEIDPISFLLTGSIYNYFRLGKIHSNLICCYKVLCFSHIYDVRVYENLDGYMKIQKVSVEAFSKRNLFSTWKLYMFNFQVF